MMAALHLTSNRWKVVTVVGLHDCKISFCKNQTNLFAGNSTGCASFWQFADEGALSLKGLLSVKWITTHLTDNHPTHLQQAHKIVTKQELELYNSQGYLYLRFQKRISRFVTTNTLMVGIRWLIARSESNWKAKTLNSLDRIFLCWNGSKWRGTLMALFRFWATRRVESCQVEVALLVRAGVFSPLMHLWKWIG